MPRLRLTARRPAARRGLLVAAAVGSGLLLTLSLPRVDLSWLAFVALVPLLLAADRVRPAAAAGLGLVAGVAFFATHVPWISMVGNDRVAGVLALVALVAIQAVFVAGFAALVPASRWLGAWRVPLLAAAWVTLELVRAHVPLGGFSWGQLGLTQHDGGPLLPLARVVGMYGLSAVVVLVNLAVAAAVLAALRQRSWRTVTAWTALAVLLPLAGVLAPPPPPVTGTPSTVTVIQGNVPFDRTNRGLTTRQVFENHVLLTLGLADGPAPDLVVWPEGAADLDPLVDPARAADVRRAAAAARAPVLVGTTTELGGDRYGTEGLLFDEQGELTDRYAKRRLVPFGEFIPFSSLMRTLVPATGQLPYDKIPGERLEPMEVPGLRFGTVICYESAYPQDTRALTRDGAEALVIITNNASYGRSALSEQHVATSQLRAVEQGRTVVHAAISGISAVVQPDGTVTQSTGLYEPAVVPALVEPRTGLTPYARFGHLVDAVPAVLAAVLVLLLVGRGLRRARHARTGSPTAQDPPARLPVSTPPG